MIPVTLACGRYDRTDALRTGTIHPDGVDLTYLAMPPEEVFYRMLRHREFDAAELSLSSYVMNPADFVAIPVFPSRTFRHNAIYVNTDSGIAEPADLVGKKVGIPEYQMTAAVFIRGILADHHGVPVDSIRYRTGGLHQPGRSEKIPLPERVTASIEPIGPYQTLADLLIDGEIDALYSARMPQPYADGHPKIRRLFADPRKVEEDYFTATGVFPIMHTVVIKRELYERNPWLARSLYDAFEQSRAQAVRTLGETNALRFSLPWLYTEVERTADIMGKDFWTYGVHANGVTLRTFLRYSYEQGLSPKELAPDELFAPETLDSFRV
ncbi:ABC transporter substrate-binding protein [Mycolicibacterium septicum]|uniref:ABC transporter substrate-binding protein n=1 Tax=Mycolicibacterium septicum TaxID=98668 RepID=UPI0023E15A85|nr:ABC transporter substrate-binding protein [Mycolicibacterium septicum]MDF3337111.1 ABC transporter substrate-binding protein [Mycolicibacterium septicum]